MTEIESNVMFKLIWNLLKLIVLTVVLALIFHNFTARLAMSAFLRYHLGAPVEIRQARVDFLNTQISFKDVEIQHPEDFPRGTLALVREIFMDSEISSLWRGGWNWDTIEVEFDTIRIVRNEQGRVNLLALKALKEGEGRKEEFQLEKFVLSMRDGFYTDLTGPADRDREQDIRLRRMTYRKVRSVRTMTEIMAWEALRGMGLESLDDGSLKAIREDFGETR
jgi:hypothetical protein